MNNREKNYTTIDKENFEIVIDGVVDVVDRGTARIAKIDGISVLEQDNKGKGSAVQKGIKYSNADLILLTTFLVIISSLIMPSTKTILSRRVTPALVFLAI